MTSPTTARSKRAGREERWRPRRGKINQSAAFPIVAIGASAGGLEVFRSFLDAQSPKRGMAFVMIQHLDPTHPSLMVELLSSHTSMIVVQAADGAALEPDHVYLIPPGVSLAISRWLAPAFETNRTAWSPFAIRLFSWLAGRGPR